MSQRRFALLVFFLAGVLVFIIYMASRNGTQSSNANAMDDYYGIGVLVPKHMSVTEPYDYGYVTDFPTASYLYIEFGRDGGPLSEPERSAQLISMLMDWQKVNPTKQVISSSSFVGWDFIYDRARTTGLLVKYQAH